MGASLWSRRLFVLIKIDIDDGADDSLIDTSRFDVVVQPRGSDLRLGDYNQGEEGKRARDPVGYIGHLTMHGRILLWWKRFYAATQCI